MTGASPVEGPGPLIVYSPHPDDETFGMGLQILRARAEGRQVYGVLLTDGEDASAYEQYYRTRPGLWTDADGNGTKGERWDYGLERRAEYVRAMGRLGVPRTDLSFFGRSGNTRHRGLQDTALDEASVYPVVAEMARLHPGATHITTMGNMPASRELADARDNPDHIAAARALEHLWTATGADVAFFKVYVYGSPWADHYAPTIAFDPLSQQGKVAAMREYEPGEPGDGRLGLGYDSSHTFFGAVVLDPREFMVRPWDF